MSRALTPVWIALGSNLGDRRAQLEGAVRSLRQSGLTVEAVSPWLETEPVGGPAGQPRFLNGVLRARTALGARDLLARLLRIEHAFGRDRSREVPGGPRLLDLDLLFHGASRIDEPDLVVPHPRLEERLFVLEPLAHLDPELVLPRSGRTVRERVDELRGVPQEVPRP